MPSRLAATVLTVDAAKMHTVDTTNVENLFSMWTIFSKCAESIEEGRRLENLSWRLWNRETFCCSAQTQASAPSLLGRVSSRHTTDDMPSLSASVDSASSEEVAHVATEDEVDRQAGALDISQPFVRIAESLESRSRGREKHITSHDLEKMVITIKKNKELQPLPAAKAIDLGTTPSHTAADETPRPSSPTMTALVEPMTVTIRAGEVTDNAQPVGSGESAHSVASSHSVVRGFSPGQGSSSYRSQSTLAPAPIPTPAVHSKAEQSRKKSNMFLLGGSSGEDEDSLDEHMKPHLAQRSSLTDGLHKQPATHKKQTSFKDEVTTRTINEGLNEDEDVFTSDEDEDVVSESAIEDDDSSDWEDSLEESARSSVDEAPMFQRVDSKPNLVSRRSLLTNLLHQPQRAAALANAASRSTPAMQRSRTASPNGPSMATSFEEEDTTLELRSPGIPHSKPIIVTTSNTHPPALSPRTTRRNMLATELTESLRRHLLWERQQKNTSAVLKRRHTAHDVANLQDYPGQKSTDASKNNSWNHYFDHGLGEYHQKGW
ncbi:MAG: hypothetical protein M1838_002381 [Thelocarpon superellum]|nr:MAG: hypothetical protein M1838_002381 [Thelocarpon superellum]